jgi:hypothetical protein
MPHRFRELPVQPRLARERAIDLLTHGGEHQQPDGVATQLAQFGGQLQAVHQWHVEIEDRQIAGVITPGPGERLTGQRSIASNHAPALGLAAKDTAVGVIVVHYPNPQFRERSLGAGLPAHPCSFLRYPDENSEGKR